MDYCFEQRACIHQVDALALEKTRGVVMEISENVAKEIALAELARSSSHMNSDVLILEERTIERPYGWIFFYQTKAYIETGDPMVGLVGNGPFLVTRIDGAVIKLGGFWEEALARLEMERGGGTWRTIERTKMTESKGTVDFEVK